MDKCFPTRPACVWGQTYLASGSGLGQVDGSPSCFSFPSSLELGFRFQPSLLNISTHGFSFLLSSLPDILDEFLQTYGSLIPISVDEVVEKLEDIFQQEFSTPQRYPLCFPTQTPQAPPLSVSQASRGHLAKPAWEASFSTRATFWFRDLEVESKWERQGLEMPAG